MIRWLAATGMIGITFLAYRSSPSENLVGGFTTSLQGRTASQRHNALLSAQRLNGAVIPPRDVFSFNGRVGSFSRDQGYRKAPVSYNGTLIDSWGGGVCQTSTTLYNAALLGGLRIVERNRHRFAPSYAPPGRDAAVAFSSIDLKLENPYDFPIRIRAEVVNDRLQIELRGRGDVPVRPQIVQDVSAIVHPTTFRIGSGGQVARVRNSGKAGFAVTVYRIWDDRREEISRDEYPMMGKVIEYR